MLGLLGMTASTLHSEFGNAAGMWWVWYLVGAVVVYLLNIFALKVGAHISSIRRHNQFAMLVWRSG